MEFFNYKENKLLIQRLENAVAEDRISHAYIFEGPSSMDKVAFAKSFIKGILCPRKDGDNCGACSLCGKIDHDNHEDIMYIRKDGASIKDKAIIAMQEKLSIKPFGGRNIAVIEDCDTMTTRAQNRLLKTLEEPPGQAVIILLSENMEKLVSTILSRCVKFRLSDGEHSANAKIAGLADEIVNKSIEGKPFYAVKYLLDKGLKDKEDTGLLLDEMEKSYRKLLLQKPGGIKLFKFDDLHQGIHAVEAARSQIRQGMKTDYALRNLLLQIGKYGG